tara:strand:- start:3574 stop:3786 length:213 start_codon:yes stop_codon:yes gene_type:complete
MKTKLTIAVAALAFFAMSCGESNEVKYSTEVTVEETTDLGNQVDELNVQIEAIEAADAEIDVTIKELDQI